MGNIEQGEFYHIQYIDNGKKDYIVKISQN